MQWFKNVSANSLKFLPSKRRTLYSLPAPPPLWVRDSKQISEDVNAAICFLSLSLPISLSFPHFTHPGQSQLPYLKQPCGEVCERSQGLLPRASTDSSATSRENGLSWKCNIQFCSSLQMTTALVDTKDNLVTQSESEPLNLVTPEFLTHSHHERECLLLF